MIDFFKDNFFTLLNLFITCILFGINFKNEIIKNKISVNVEIVKMLPYRICKIMDCFIMMSNINKENTIEKEKKEEFQKFLNKEFIDIIANVLCYGSKDAVAIAVRMQEVGYDVQNCKPNKEIIVLYVILIVQIKYDLTSEIISPESWFRLKLNDYSSDRTQCVELINKFIDELDLNKKFKVKS